MAKDGKNKPAPTPDISRGNPLVTKAGTILPYWETSAKLVDEWITAGHIDTTAGERNRLQAAIVQLVQDNIVAACGQLCRLCRDGVPLQPGTDYHGMHRKTACPAAEIRRNLLPIQGPAVAMDDIEAAENVRLLMRLSKATAVYCTQALDAAGGDFEAALRSCRTHMANAKK